MAEEKLDWHTMLISNEKTVYDALSTLDKSFGEVVIVVDEYMHLLGTITDGDIRRAILRGVELHDSVTCVMNSKPYHVPNTLHKHEAFVLMRRAVIRQLPIVDENGRVCGVHTLSTMLDIPSIDNQVIIMAGGLGSRLGELTKEMPKPMLPIDGKPILEHVLSEFIDQGFHRFLISVNYKAEIIEQYFGHGERFGVSIEYLREDKRLGTAGALSLLSEIPLQSFIVANGDILTKLNFPDLLHYHGHHESYATMVIREHDYQIPFGVVETGIQNEILNIHEKPRYTYSVNAGIYCLEPEVLNYIPKDRYFDMTTLFDVLREHDRHIVAYSLKDYWIDIGRIADLEKAREEFSEVFENDRAE